MKLEYSQFGRQACGHKIIPLMGPGDSGLGACFDDAYNMNPRRILPFSYNPLPVFLEPYILPDFEFSRQHI
jgi:hypothetical protein